MKIVYLFAVAPMLLAGCTSADPLPEVVAIRSPLIASAKVPTTHFHQAVKGYVHRVPVAPDPWIQGTAPPAGQTGADQLPTPGKTP